MAFTQPSGVTSTRRSCADMPTLARVESQDIADGLSLGTSLTPGGLWTLVHGQDGGTDGFADGGCGC
jgi:hypothetical protein